MKYELAFKLKINNYPQESPIMGKRVDIENLKTTGIFINGPEGKVYVPTLSELISAVVGNKRNTFSLDYDEEWSLYEEPNRDGPWQARYYDQTPVGFYEKGGKSPEEVVANLWLKLNGPDF